MIPFIVAPRAIFPVLALLILIVPFSNVRGMVRWVIFKFEEFCAVIQLGNETSRIMRSVVGALLRTKGETVIFPLKGSDGSISLKEFQVPPRIIPPAF